MKTMFLVKDIIWPAGRPDLPSEAEIGIPGYLTELGHEDFEPNASTDDDDGDDDDDYEPSDEACDAFDAEWEREVFLILTKQFGVTPISYGTYGPSPA
jgi:hypothetical protein